MQTEADTFSPIAEAERIVADMPDKPEIRHNCVQASYSSREDVLFMPPSALFDSREEGEAYPAHLAES